MALETVVSPQDPFGCYTARSDLYSWPDVGGGSIIPGFFDDIEVDKLEPLEFNENFFGISQFIDHHQWQDGSSGSSVPESVVYPTNYSCSPSRLQVEADPAIDRAVVVGERPKRRRGKSGKNKEDIENQRMTHIAVERNRRKQMNEYLAVLRSLMPESYVQRGDQASIIGGAINFVKELEQQLHILDTRKQSAHPPTEGSPSPLPFSECFTIPQYSSAPTISNPDSRPPDTSIIGEAAKATATAVSHRNEVADVEAMMVESHANMKIRSKRRPKQLLRLVSGLQGLRLTVLHLNVSTVGQYVLYSLSLKVEDDCKLTTVDEISSAVYRLMVMIQEEAYS